MRLRIASRKSDLARLQSYHVARALKKNNSHLDIEFIFKSSLGDRNLDAPLWTMGDKGVFTQDFHQDLMDKKVDIVVHSWKDLPIEPRQSTRLAATLPRADQRDLLLVPKKSWEQAQEQGCLQVLTSSPRRIYNLNEFLPQALPYNFKKIKFTNIRGNIPTRIKKLFLGEGHALVLAKAAWDRLVHPQVDDECEVFSTLSAQLQLDLQKCRWMVLPLSVNPTAAGQGALAIEVSAQASSELLELLKKINCESTFKTVEAEREVLKSYGGGCHQKIGVSFLEKNYGSIFCLKGETDQGETLNTFQCRKPDDKKIEADQAWPLDPKTEVFFEREVLPVDTEVLKQKDLWVARSNALPEHDQHQDQLIWTAGVKSWLKLAQRGLWVNGCNDNLGEAEDLKLEALSEPKWLKLTHVDSRHGLWPVLATYRLLPKAQAPDLTGKKYFFWMSSSSFKRAVELFPEILEGHHACGPGHTCTELKKMIKDKSKLTIYLSYENWRRQFR